MFHHVKYSTKESAGIMTTPLQIGILGAGRVGSAIARQSLAAGHQVRIATSKPASEIQLITEVVTPGAKAVNRDELAGSDLIILAVPLHRYRSIDTSVVQGHTVIDTMNYWSPVDGVIEEFEQGHSTSEVIAEFLGEVNLVKTLNHIGYADIESQALPPATENRRALAVAADSAQAAALTAEFIDSLGFDPVIAGGLHQGIAFENGTEIFNGQHTAESLRALLDGCPAELTHA